MHFSLHFLANYRQCFLSEQQEFGDNAAAAAVRRAGRDLNIYEVQETDHHHRFVPPLHTKLETLFFW